MKKAQITLFIIIGILVLIAFGLVFYLGSFNNQTQKQRKEAIQTQPLQDYIISCLAITTADAFLLLGKQGGTIYQSQGGITSDQASTNQITRSDSRFGNLKMNYAILPPEGNIGTLFSATIPEYPFQTFPYTEDQIIFTGYYGINKLPPLYKINQKTGERNINSIQETIETYIAKKIKECTDWETFTSKGYTIKTEEPQATIMLPEDETQLSRETQTTIQINWKITIANQKGEQTTLEKFVHKIPLQFANTYYFAQAIIDSDVTDISYQPTSTERYQINTQDNTNYSIITITDTQNTVNNELYTFTVARKNRAPALWQIDHTQTANYLFHILPDNSDGPELAITNNQLKIIDIGCPDTQELTFFINATDPDEQTIMYDVTPKKITQPGLTPIRITAKDSSTNTAFDYQEIPLRVTLCVIS